MKTLTNHPPTLETGSIMERYQQLLAKRRAQMMHDIMERVIRRELGIHGPTTPDWLFSAAISNGFKWDCVRVLRHSLSEEQQPDFLTIRRYGRDIYSEALPTAL